MQHRRDPHTRSFAPAGAWRFDASTSRLEFSVRHVMVSTVEGRFHEFAGVLEIDESGRATGTATIAVASVDTDNRKRDASLRSPDFFWAERYPTIDFVADTIRQVGAGQLRVGGRLTIRGVTRRVELEAVVDEMTRDTRGNERLTLALRADVVQRPFGLGWRTLKDHGVVLGEKVRVRATISAVRAEAQVALAA
jgi:polyisoprenoid-binding protein YceI